MKTFSIREAFQFGWAEFKKYPWKYVGITFIAVLIQVLTQVPFLGIVAWVVSVAVSIGFIKILLGSYEGKVPEVNTLFSEWKKFFRALGIGLLIALIVFMPAALFYALGVIGAFIIPQGYQLVPLIVGGIVAFAFLLVFAIRYMFALYFLVEKNTKIVESLKLSAQMTKGIKLKIIALFICLILANIAGFIVLGVGLFVSIPVTRLALVHVYKKLSANNDVTIVPEETTTHEHQEAEVKEESIG